MSAACAYCLTETELTREHIVPSFLYRANPRAKFGFNLKADRFISWEAQIKDVCSKCNNEHLSKLDAYAHAFYVQNRIETYVKDEKMLPMIYDFSLLSRFLLKVTFNCLRYKGQDTEWLLPFLDFILYGVDRPVDLRFKLGVEIIRCYKIKTSDRLLLPDEIKGMEYMPPHMIRIGQFWTSTSIFGRYVFLNNFCFFLIVSKRSASSDGMRDMLTWLLNTSPGVVFLDPHVKKVTIAVSSVTTKDRYEDTALGLMDKWHAYVKKT